MSDLKSDSRMFAEPPEEKSFPVTAVAIAAVVIAVVVGVLVAVGRKSGGPVAPTTLQPVAAYAARLEVTGVQMSEATSLTGGKSTYVDGHIANRGTATVSGITVQVIFGNEEKMPPQMETMGLPLVYMHDPYVDTRSVSASPLAPGAEADFRLVFEDIRPNWDQKPPEIRVVGVVTR